MDLSSGASSDDYIEVSNHTIPTHYDTSVTVDGLYTPGVPHGGKPTWIREEGSLRIFYHKHFRGGVWCISDQIETSSGRFGYVYAKDSTDDRLPPAGIWSPRFDFQSSCQLEFIPIRALTCTATALDCGNLHVEVSDISGTTVHALQIGPEQTWLELRQVLTETANLKGSCFLLPDGRVLSKSDDGALLKNLTDT